MSVRKRLETRDLQYLKTLIQPVDYGKWDRHTIDRDDGPFVQIWLVKFFICGLSFSLLTICRTFASQDIAYQRILGFPIIFKSGLVPV